MSAPSRRPEIRRRRTRAAKIHQLRKRLAAAKTDAEKQRITAKLTEALDRFSGSAAVEIVRRHVNDAAARRLFLHRPPASSPVAAKSPPICW